MREIVDFEQIEEFIQKLRKKYPACKVAFTNGCFDLIHRGHVAYLEMAKEQADFLVLGLNSDDSVRRLKGKERPYINQEDRAFILSRLESVDIVCIFDQDTPLELIKRVKPDFLVKGADYQLDEIVGRQEVEQYGGKVLTIPLIKGRSTTNIVNKIKNKT